MKCFYNVKSNLWLFFHQEALNRAIQSEIALEFSDLPELYETIGNIDTVVNFLLSVNCSADFSLNSFMEETLQMKPLPSQKVLLNSDIFPAFIFIVRYIWLIVW